MLHGILYGILLVNGLFMPHSRQLAEQCARNSFDVVNVRDKLYKNALEM